MACLICIVMHWTPLAGASEVVLHHPAELGTMEFIERGVFNRSPQHDSEIWASKLFPLSWAQCDGHSQWFGFRTLEGEPFLPKGRVTEIVGITFGQRQSTNVPCDGTSRTKGWAISVAEQSYANPLVCGIGVESAGFSKNGHMGAIAFAEIASSQRVGFSGGIGRLLSSSHLENIQYQQTEGDDNGGTLKVSFFHLMLSMGLAGLGIFCISRGLGMTDSGLRKGILVFWIGVILWMCGFAGMVHWSVRI